MHATDAPQSAPKHSNFKRFFFRGLAILLPSVLTIWILIAAYQFVQGKIAQPINAGVRWAFAQASPIPQPSDIDLTEMKERISQEKGDDLRAWRKHEFSDSWLEHRTRREMVTQWWSKYAWGMDLIGLIIAVILIYLAGAFLGSFIGARLFHRAELMIKRLPVFKQVYPAVKQVTDFLVGDPTRKSEKAMYSKVVAVEYPRKGLWSVGLLTGNTMQNIQDSAGEKCLTVFVPSSPTPFTGYVITVPKRDTIDLPISIEEALQFVISGGVVVPPSQLIVDETDPAALPPPAPPVPPAPPSASA